MAGSQFDIRDHLDKLKGDGGRDTPNGEHSFECPACGADNFKVDISTGKWSCFACNCADTKEGKRRIRDAISPAINPNGTTNGRGPTTKASRQAPRRPSKASASPAVPLPGNAAEIALATLLEPFPERPPDKLPDGHVQLYSDTQKAVLRINEKGKKEFPVSHRATPQDPWKSNAGTVRWPLWMEDEAIQQGPGHWIAEAEGPKCADWLRAGGLVAVSQPGHSATNVKEIAIRYQCLIKAGVAGVVYLVDNNDEGTLKAAKCLEAAAQVGLPLLRINAVDVWPGLPKGGSIDDALGTPAERVQALIAAIPAALEKDRHQQHQQQQDNLQQPEDEEPLSFNELMGALVEALKQGDVDAEMNLRGILCSSRFGRRTDSQINARALAFVKLQELGLDPASPLPTPPDSVDMDEEDGMDYLVPGFIPRNDVAMVVGARGTGKTTLALGFSKAVVEQTGFLDRTQKASHGDVLFIASDSGTAPLNKDMQDLGLSGPAYKEGPQRQFFIWAHSRKAKTEAWSASIRDLLRLLDFVKRRQVALVVMDAAKKICSLGGISYSNNEEVLAWLAFIKEVICQYCAVVILNHEGASGPMSNAGAKAWGEQVSTLIFIRKEEPGNGSPEYRKLILDKGRLGDERSIFYGLEEGDLLVRKGTEIVGNCEEAILRFLAAQAKKNIDMTSKADLLLALCGEGKPSPKTLANTLGLMVKKPKPKIVRRTRGKATGFYALSPKQLFLATQAMEASAHNPDGNASAHGPAEEASAHNPDKDPSQDAAADDQTQRINTTPDPDPLKKALGNGNSHIKKVVIERDLVSSRCVPDGNSSGIPGNSPPIPDEFPTGNDRELVGNSEEFSDGQAFGLLSSQWELSVLRGDPDSPPSGHPEDGDLVHQGLGALAPPALLARHQQRLADQPIRAYSHPLDGDLGGDIDQALALALNRRVQELQRTGRLVPLVGAGDSVDPEPITPLAHQMNDSTPATDHGFGPQLDGWIAANGNGQAPHQGQPGGATPSPATPATDHGFGPELDAVCDALKAQAETGHQEDT